MSRLWLDEYHGVYVVRCRQIELYSTFESSCPAGQPEVMRSPSGRPLAVTPRWPRSQWSRRPPTNPMSTIGAVRRAPSARKTRCRYSWGVSTTWTSESERGPGCWSSSMMPQVSRYKQITHCRMRNFLIFFRTKFTKPGVKRFTRKIAFCKYLERKNKLFLNSIRPDKS